MHESEFQGQFSVAQEARNREHAEAQAARTEASNNKLAELAGEIASERQRLSQVVSDFQSQFSTAQEARNREHAEAQAGRQEKFAALIADTSQKITEQNAEYARQREIAFKQYEESLAKLNKDYGDAAQVILKDIEDHKSSVEKLVGVIGNLGVTSGHLRTANYARGATWFWHVVTVAALIALILFGYYVLLPTINGSVTWESLASRVLLTLTFGVLAAYSARQADKYLDIERRNRKLALELEALGPYLAPLPREKQDEFRLKVGELSFGREERGLGRGDKSPATVIDLLAQSPELLRLLQTIVEATKAK
jgi:hypothetical protein